MKENKSNDLYGGFDFKYSKNVYDFEYDFQVTIYRKDSFVDCIQCDDYEILSKNGLNILQLSIDNKIYKINLNMIENYNIS